MNAGRALTLVLALLISGRLSAPSSARAADGGVALAGDASVRFRVFALRPIENLAFSPDPEAPLQPLEFYPTARSPEYIAGVSAPLRFVDTRTGVPVAEVALSPVMTEPLLVFVSGRPGAREKFEVLVVDAALGVHPRGQLMILNLSGLDLRGSMSGRTIQVVPGLQRIGPVRGAAKLDLRAIHGTRELRAYSDQISVGSGERALLILFPPFYAGSLEVQGRLLKD